MGMQKKGKMQGDNEKCVVFMGKERSLMTCSGHARGERRGTREKEVV
jgi:hypothetical protein